MNFGEYNLYEDYVLVTQVQWQKLSSHFGGAPEIMLQCVTHPTVTLDVPNPPSPTHEGVVKG